ncbi:MFS transporter [Pseudomonas typographi]|uniref:MFS transporter n=1 Tax=Pseudomonas typographi TaxID=2715964 RepID=A0ABR7YY20_9PSED|nr:MFS transporter [Pseudomonas typographi]MBD1550458.1 MFS transporter [Pseudomonas typographi]MBD1587865.1 MFS transporter [Pseudomonas typographi]MBD1598073.1 MFS transporter [Pseudomonas typographi]
MNPVPESVHIQAIDSAVAKVKRHVLPLFVLMFIVNYIDRVNIGFVRTHMEVDLGIGVVAYGFGAGLFFVGYALFEIPSSILMQRFGARIWLTRIMLTWGAAAMAMAFVRNETEFYICRFLLGAAEAGFFPGVAYYFTQWLPSRERAKAMAIFIGGSAVASVIAGPVSGALLLLQGLGLRGWQWMFLVEGFASIALCVVVWKVLHSYPRQAKWLTAPEKQALAEVIAQEQREREAAYTAPPSVFKLLMDRQILLHCFLFFTIAQMVYGVTFWLPTMIRQMGALSDLQVGLLNSIPWVIAVIAMYSFAVLAGRWLNQKAWLAITLVIAGVGLFVSTLGGPLFGFIATCFAAIGFKSATAMFWPIPQRYLDARIAAGILALINSVGTLGGFIGPSVFGLLEAHTGTIEGGLYTLSATSIIAAVMVYFARSVPRGDSPATTPVAMGQRG